MDRDQPSARFRFSCAHEIGHYVLRKADLTPENAFVDKRSDRDRGLSDEVYANEFAGSLLMPKGALIAAVAAGEDNYDLARRFSVSLVAVTYRRSLLRL